MFIYCLKSYFAQTEENALLLRSTALHTLTSLAGLCAASHPSEFENTIGIVVENLTHQNDGIHPGIALC